MNAKNRNILYGYRFENGIIVADESESEIVKLVFAEYVKGLSLLKIANLLTEKGIEYLPNQVNWNKGKIKRIIEDKRYLGNDKYPKIIEMELFVQTNSSKVSRDTTKNVKRTSYVYKLNIPVICSECGGQMRRTHHPRLTVTERWICNECGQSVGIFDEELLCKVTDNLNYLIHNPLLIKSESATDKSLETIRTENEISRMLEIPNADKEILQQKIFDLAALKYADLDSGSYISEQIKAEFENAEPLAEISLPLLMKTTQAIQLNTDSEISLVLKNNQTIRKEKIYGTENSQIHSTDNNGTIKCKESISARESRSLLPRIYKAG